MPYSRLYVPLIESERRIGKSLVRPRNIYRIAVYKYADGTQKTLSGIYTSLVFVIGIHDKKIHCLKFGEIRPVLFLRWLSLVMKYGVVEDDILTAKHLKDVIIKSDITGHQIFKGYVKTRRIYKIEPSIYRTYNLSGIKQITEVKIKNSFLLEAID